MVVVEIDDSNVAGREVVEQASVVEVQGHPPLRGELRVEMDHAADDGGRDGWWEAAESREGGVRPRARGGGLVQVLTLDPLVDQEWPVPPFDHGKERSEKGTLGMATIRVRNPEFDEFEAPPGDDAQIRIERVADLRSLLL